LEVASFVLELKETLLAVPLLGRVVEAVVMLEAVLEDELVQGVVKADVERVTSGLRSSQRGST
jgi:hypothetical protein